MEDENEYVSFFGTELIKAVCDHQGIKGHKASNILDFAVHCGSQ